MRSKRPPRRPKGQAGRLVWARAWHKTPVSRASGAVRACLRQAWRRRRRRRRPRRLLFPPPAAAAAAAEPPEEKGGRRRARSCAPAERRPFLPSRPGLK
ncbi:Hypothetical predicted protein [Podarcis lilfordi]|uniref:Uncharacterized protein n=1 Tax=Podarcis lilfordi TaxID=74358 RepID=A0AA35LCV4_9SAUR|nr:Hypothetical predicted protein [Podarcis lilfordi]